MSVCVVMVTYCSCININLSSEPSLYLGLVTHSVLFFQSFLQPPCTAILALLRENAVKRLIDITCSSQAADEGLWRAVFGPEPVAKFLYCEYLLGDEEEDNLHHLLLLLTTIVHYVLLK